ncbi:MAG: CorA family divalent cation transporter, partial [Burkholderiales bacterium]
MLYAYFLKLGYLQKVDYQEDQIPLSEAVWLDCYNLTEEERNVISDVFSINLPSRHKMRSLESSSRLYEENSILYMTANVISHSTSSSPLSEAITFALTPTTLITLRYSEPYAFEQFSHRVIKAFNVFTTPQKILLGLIDAIVDRAADILEHSGDRIDVISDRIFEKEVTRFPSNTKPNTQSSASDLTALLIDIGLTNDLVSKMHQSMGYFYRVLKFLNAHLEEISHEN